MTVTEEDFRAYEEVRESGTTNMFAITAVADLAGLSKEKVKWIMANYDALCAKYPDVRQP